MGSVVSWAIEHGDSLTLLANMGSESVDAVITDPPYSSGGLHRSDRQGSAKAKYLESGSGSLDRLPEFYGDSRTERGLQLWASLWLAEAWRVTKPGGAIAVFCDWRSMPTLSDALQAGGWVWRGTGVWIKPASRSRPMMGGLWNDTEYVLWGSRDARTAGECLPGTWQVAAPPSATRLHPTEKPQAILDDLVRLAPSAGRVLDPFCGSAATGVSALRQGRSFHGIELSAEYAERGRERLTTFETAGEDVTYDEPGLFAAAEAAS